MSSEDPAASADRAEQAEQRARLAADRVEAASTEAEITEREAVAAAIESDALLLDVESQRLAAQVSEARPFGLPTRSEGVSPLRSGFLLAAGGLLAFGLAEAVVSVQHELLLVLLAAFIAIGLDPVVAFLVGRGIPRGVAVALIAITVLGAVAGFAAVAIPPLSRQTSHLIDEVPHYLQELKDRNSTLGKLNLKFHLIDKAQKEASGSAGSAAGGLLRAGSTVLSATFQTIIVLVLVVYFLADLAQIKSAGYRLFPLHRRPRIGLLGDEVIARIGGYVLGNVFTSLVATAGNYVVLAILGVPYAFVLSVLVGVLDLVPLIGSTVGGAIVALVALAAVSTTAAVVTLVYHVFYRVFEDYLLNPRVLRRTVDVKPVVTIVAVLIGGALLGVIGALIAVPAAAAIQLYVTEVVYPLRDSDPNGT